MEPITNRFSNGEWAKNVKTVGELIKELSRLPIWLPVGDERGRDIVIFNRHKLDPHLEFTDGGEWDDTGNGEDEEVW